MSASRETAQTYRSTPMAVMPSVVVRGLFLGLVYAAFAGIFLGATAVVRGEIDPRSVDPVALSETFASSETQLLLVFGTVTLVPFVTVVAVAYVDYRSRRYVFEDDRLTEIRGVLGERETSIPYDDIENLSFTRSRIQRQFGTGTVRINELELEDEYDYEFDVRYVQNPEMFYSELRSALVDGDTSRRDLPPVEESLFGGDISSLSDGMLAVDTSSPYLMPRAILHPNARRAAMVSLLNGVVFSGTLSLILLTMLVTFASFGLVPTPTMVGGYVLLLGGLVVLGALASYRSYDRMQYEIYDDHIRKVAGSKKTSIQFSDVATVRRQARILSLTRLLDRGQGGHVCLVGADGLEHLTLEYVENPDEVETHLTQLVAAAD